MSLGTRLIHHIGTSAYLRIYWGNDCKTKRGIMSYHNSMKLITTSNIPYDHELGGNIKDYTDDKWPTHCDNCGIVVPPVDTIDGNTGRNLINRQVFRERLYNTASGSPEPGDIFWAEWFHSDGYCVLWDNCTDPRGHLHAVTPSGETWDIDGRASNCTKNDDRNHRCWVRHGPPEKITVDKNGVTCAAGGGSILVTGYHGFLINGRFT